MQTFQKRIAAQCEANEKGYQKGSGVMGFSDPL